MKEIAYNRLIALLEASNEPAIVECLGLVRESTPGYMFGDALPANEVWDIYSKRKTWNESTSNPKRNRISGFEELVTRLPKGSNEKVRIHTLEWQEITVMIFTDEETVSLFGSLRIPKSWPVNRDVKSLSLAMGWTSRIDNPVGRPA